MDKAQQRNRRLDRVLGDGIEYLPTPQRQAMIHRLGALVIIIVAFGLMLAVATAARMLV